jgi:glycosidase
MRILFDSKKLEFKDPFGTLVPNQSCSLHIHVPSDVNATMVMCVVCRENGEELHRFPMSKHKKLGAYDVFRGEISLKECGLYFYYFHIVQSGKGFRLFKVGNETNMESGDLWQVSCVPEDFTTPDWAKGAVIYQVFPDRFHKSGECDLTGKLQPYTVHENWSDDVDWRPTADGVVLNNDFYGGNFRGITEKMDYIASLGVEILYLNPISKSFSSHRYDTGDYKTPDPMLGTEDDFTALCDAAHKHGIKVVLDGVYSHTGSNSLYFDKEGTFGGKGAYQDPCSPFRSWYTFHQYPDIYESWWNFDTLPTVKKMDPAFIRYVISDEDSVVAHWLKLGADGFRLDVVDELPNEFVFLLKQRIRELKPDALLMGEVWEDASNKIAYDVRRRYFVDGVLDSCMNYPFRTAILNFLRQVDDGKALADTVMSILENYPPQVVSCNMNLLGTHDTPRILTALVDDFDGNREALAARKLTAEDRILAEERLLMASFLQYMLPGAPSLYYADETGMEGHKDPFNRRTFPWGKEDETLLAHFRGLGQLRKNSPVLRLGSLEFFRSENGQIGFRREHEGRSIRIYVNRSKDNWEIPAGKILFARKVKSLAPDWLCVEPMGFCVIEA